jgi:hypothetical protein
LRRPLFFAPPNEDIEKVKTPSENGGRNTTAQEG